MSNASYYLIVPSNPEHLSMRITHLPISRPSDLDWNETPARHSYEDGVRNKVCSAWVQQLWGVAGYPKGAGGG